MAEPRRTKNVTAMLVALLEGPADGMYGLEIGRAGGIKIGSIYPTLDKLIAAGWVKSRKEKGDAVALGRPLRTYYKLTAAGAKVALGARESLPRPAPTGAKGALA